MQLRECHGAVGEGIEEGSFGVGAEVAADQLTRLCDDGRRNDQRSRAVTNHLTHAW